MVGNFRGKSDKAPRINFRGFKFRGCNPVYKCVVLCQRQTDDVIDGFAMDARYRDATSLVSTSLLTSARTFEEIAWTRVSLESKAPSAG